MSPRATASGVISMLLVGGSVGISALLTSYPLCTAQAVRYGLAVIALQIYLRIRKQSLARPRTQEIPRLIALGATGQVAFNLCLVVGLRYAEPAAIGVIVGTVPIFLAICVPLFAGLQPQGRLVIASVIVVSGVALVEGTGTASLLGALLAMGALICEVSFTLLAIPLLPRLQPIGVSFYSTLSAGLISAALIPVIDRRFVVPTSTEFTTVIFLALFVSAMAPLTWYVCVREIGGDRAGLLGGLMPIAALLSGALTGAKEITLGAMVGSVLVGAGVVFGLAKHRKKPLLPENSVENQLVVMQSHSGPR